MGDTLIDVWIDVDANNTNITRAREELYMYMQEDSTIKHTMYVDGEVFTYIPPPVIVEASRDDPWEFFVLGGMMMAIAIGVMIIAFAVWYYTFWLPSKKEYEKKKNAKTITPEPPTPGGALIEDDEDIPKGL